MNTENTNDPKIELLKSVKNLVTVEDFKAVFQRILEVLVESRKGFDAHVDAAIANSIAELKERFAQFESEAREKNESVSDELKLDLQSQTSELRDLLGKALGLLDSANAVEAPEVDYSKVAIIAKETVLPLLPKQAEQIKETPQSIRDALESLEKGEKLEIEAIEGLPEELKKLKKKVGDNFYGSSGILQVRAGTGITVDNSNPQYPTINSTGGGGAVDSVNGETGAVTLTTDDISDSGQTNKWATASEKTKLGHISVTQAVDLDTIESDTTANNAKITNATHTGEVTGSGALTVDKTVITGKTGITPASDDLLLISDTSDGGNLKKVLISDLPSGGGVSDGDKGDITVSGSGTVWTIDNGVVTLAKQADVATSTIFYRKTAGTGVPEVQTLATLKTDLGLSGTNSGDQTSIVGITGTKAQFDTAVTDGDFLFVGDITQYTDEMAQDAVGSIFTDSAEIDFTYNDGAPSITASIVAGSIDETKLDASVNASLVLANNALPSSYLDTDGTLSANSDAKVPSQKAVKTYVDAVAQGLSIKESVRVATAAALPTNTYNNGASGVGATLTAIAVGVLTVDGVAVALNDRVLVKDEVATANNGIYLCTVAGTAGVAYVLTRSTSFDSGVEISGAFTFVEEGSTNADNGYVCTTNDPITVGTTGISFTQFSGAGQIVAGNALTKSGNTLDVAVDGTTIEVDSDALRRGALTGAITAPAGSNTTSLGSFTVAQLNTAISDGDVATGGGTATGTNTGDQTTIVGITGTKAQFDTAVTDGNFLFVGDITQYTDEMAQDAVGAMVDTTLEYVDATPLLRRAALTGDVTAPAGSNTTSIDKTAITGKTGATPVGADYIMFSDDSDGGNLKKALISDLPTGGGGSDTAFDPNTTGSWFVQQLFASTLGNAAGTATGIIQWSVSGTSGYYSFYLPSVIGGTQDELLFSDVNRIISRHMWRRTSGTAINGMGFGSAIDSVYLATSVAGTRACFTWTDATNLYCVTSDGTGTPTSTAVTGSPTSGNWNEYKIDYNPDATECKFYFNGTLVATHTTELPVNGNECRFMFGSSTTSSLAWSPVQLAIKLT